MTQNSFHIRHMTEREVAMAVDWAAAEGWNPGLHDARCFGSADSEGFLVGIKDGEPIGCISAVRYGSEFGFIGFYIVRPPWRGQGYGLHLWQAAMAQLEGRVVGLDGVVAEQQNYRKAGFELAYRNIRYSAVFPEQAADGCEDRGPSLRIIPACRLDPAELADFDSKLFFTARPEFLSAWFSQPAATALVALYGDKLVGYGVIRPCRSGCKIGPLFADSPVVAEKLLLSLVNGVNGETVFLDVPELNAAAMALAAKHQMTKVFETARMYKGQAPRLNLDMIFGVTTFELG